MLLYLSIRDIQLPCRDKKLVSYMKYLRNEYGILSSELHIMEFGIDKKLCLDYFIDEISKWRGQ